MTGITGRYAMMRGSQTTHTIDQGPNLTESGQSMKTQTMMPFKARYKQEQIGETRNNMSIPSPEHSFEYKDVAQSLENQPTSA